MIISPRSGQVPGVGSFLRDLLISNFDRRLLSRSKSLAEQFLAGAVFDDYLHDVGSAFCMFVLSGGRVGDTQACLVLIWRTLNL